MIAYFDWSLLADLVSSDLEVHVTCPKCQSNSASIIPAEIRRYRNCPRTLSRPPVTPPPDVRICLDCVWSEFSVPQS